MVMQIQFKYIYANRVKITLTHLKYIYVNSVHILHVDYEFLGFTNSVQVWIRKLSLSIFTMFKYDYKRFENLMS